MSMSNCCRFTLLIMTLCLNASAARGDGLDLRNVTIPGRYVVELAAGIGSCIPLPNWSASKVFYAVAGTNGAPPAIEPAIDRFCVYEGDDANVGDLVTERDNGSFARLEPDFYPVVGAAQPPDPVLEPLTWVALQEQFHHQAGRVPLDIISGNTKPQVVVIDTAPTRSHEPERHPGRSGHGHALLNMAKSLLCATSTGDCVSDLTSRLALAYYRDSDTGDIVRDEVGGGDMGSLVDLARAIQGAVAEWLDGAERPRLIVNLSVGWDARRGGLEPTPDTMPLAIEIVYRALENLSCHGGLAVTTTGNDGGTDALGAWLPGHWEDRPAPDLAVCEAALGRSLDPADFPASGDGFYNSLVMSLSGHRYDRRPLSNASPESQARIAAYGQAATVESHVSGVPTRNLTGTSVSTLVASAAVAAMSYYLWDSPLFKIRELLYASGHDLGRPADFCLGATCSQDDSAWTVRSINVCAALTRACQDTSLPCPSLPVCEGPDDVPPDLPTEIIGIFDGIEPPPETINGLFLTADFPLQPPCHRGIQYYDPADGLPSNPCPRDQVATSLGNPVQTAPATIPCPTCPLYQFSQSLLIEIDPEFEGQLSDPTLIACGNRYSLPIPSLSAGSRIHVQNIFVQPGCHPVKLSFMVSSATGVSSIVNPILVVPH